MPLVFGCHRELRPVPDKPNDTGINPEIKASPDFNWAMSHEVLFLVKNATQKVISITSTDGTLVFHKAFSAGGKYDARIDLPVRCNSVLVNGKPVQVEGKAVVVDLPGTKSADFGSSSLCFNGQQAYAVGGDPVSDYPFTISAWFKADEYPAGGDNMVVFALAQSNKSNRYFGVYLEYEQNGVNPGTISIRGQKGGTMQNFYSDVVAQTGTWYHVAAVFEDASMRRLYINGEPAGEDTRKVNLPGMNEFSLGRWGGKYPGSYLHGSVGDVRIWDYARTQEEIAADMEISLSGNETGLIGYWPCEEGAGSVAYDLSPEGNDLSLSAQVQWCEGPANVDSDGDGIPDDQDDYPYDPTRAFNNFWPAGFGTLAFEDLWPSIGDYDFNDLVMGYRFKVVTNAENYLVEAFGDFEVIATGAGLENGFGFSLPNINIPAEQLEVSGYLAGHDVTTFEPNGLEAGPAEVTVIVADVVPYVGNTRAGNPYNEPVPIQVHIGINSGSYVFDDLGMSSFNPFLIVDRNRSHEIHQAGFPPTSLADGSLFGTKDDASNPPVDYYRSIDNLPWALNFPENFDYTFERDTIWQGYLKFIDWVNANGLQFPDWYTDQPGYRDASMIYSPD